MRGAAVAMRCMPLVLRMALIYYKTINQRESGKRHRLPMKAMDAPACWLAVMLRVRFVQQWFNLANSVVVHTASHDEDPEGAQPGGAPEAPRTT